MSKEKTEVKKEEGKEEKILFYDPGLNVSYDIKLSAAIKYIENAKVLEKKLKEEGKI